MPLVDAAVDSFYVREGKWCLSGWAYQSNEGRRLPVDSIDVGGRNGGDLGVLLPDSASSDELRFEISSSDELSIAGIVLGKQQCFAVVGGACSAIRIASKVRGLFIRQLVSFWGRGDVVEARGAIVQAALLLAREKRTGRFPAVQRLPIETGFKSYDEDVILGQDGFFFLFGGSNVVNELYSRRVDDGFLSQWVKLIEQREKLAEDQGVGFLQMIVPEKQSVLSDLYPIDQSGCTPLLASISKAMASRSCYLDAFEVLKDIYVKSGAVPYRRVDSHLSLHGAMGLALAMAHKIDSGMSSLTKPVLVSRTIGGDLGSKFGYGQFVEDALYPDIDCWQFAKEKPRLVRSETPQSGFTGTLREWASETFLSEKTVLVFGNSIFERGDDPFGLSWWLARIFRRVRFVWSAKVDWAQLRDFGPDVVVAQTVERFTGGLPPS